MTPEKLNELEAIATEFRDTTVLELIAEIRRLRNEVHFGLATEWIDVQGDDE